ncbi:tolloid-like protein 2 [Ptychodera flava]|uniref:tolloid-like protein 2 n=1 Tax=Ptychodera flava TaxID=63121 RepID=UPI00396A5707
MNNIVDAATSKELAVGEIITVHDVEGVVRLPVEVKLKPYCDKEECSGCGSPSILTDATGSIFSTNFLTGDEQYYPESYCMWTIIAPVGRYIHLNFHSFDVPGRTYGDQIKCTSYLAFYNGSEVNDDQRLAQFCGSQIPLLSSTSNELTVVFSTSRSGDGRGFNATYYTTGCMLSECGHDTYLNSECGYINTLGYPNPYPPQSKCSWNIQVEDGDVIHMEFFDFDVGDSDTICSSDFVRVSEANRSTTFCGHDNPGYFISATSQLHIEFQSGQAGVRGYTGFMAKYSAVPYQHNECENDWAQFGKYCYRFSQEETGLTWNQAEGKCRQVGANLVSILNREESNFIIYSLSRVWLHGDSKTYIGLSDEVQSGKYRWTDGIQ